MRVAVIPTGKAELKGIGRALKRLFPAHAFEVVPKVAATDDPFEGFTSSELPPPPAPVRSELDILVQELAAWACRKDVDGVVVLDDLELDNVPQPQVVVDCVRHAVEGHLASLTDRRVAKRTAAALQTKASVHFAAPMLEAWFFADPGGLQRAGVAPGRLPAKLGCGTSFEAFRTADAAFDADDGSTCTFWASLPPDERDRKQARPGWVQRGARRVEHPKDYLRWLRAEPGKRCCTGYRDKKDGGAALAALDWQAALQAGHELPYLRAFVADLADLLGEPLPVPGGAEAPWTSRHRLPAQPVLRNL